MIQYLTIIMCHISANKQKKTVKAEIEHKWQ